MNQSQSTLTAERLAVQIEELQYDPRVSGSDGIFQVLAGRILEEGLDADIFELNTPYRKICEVLHRSRLRALQDKISSEQRHWHLFTDLIDFLTRESLLPQFENEYFMPLSVGEKCDCLATILREPEWLLGIQRHKTKSDSRKKKMKWNKTRAFIWAVCDKDEPGKKLTSGQYNNKITGEYNEFFPEKGPSGTSSQLTYMADMGFMEKETKKNGYCPHPDYTYLIDEARELIEKNYRKKLCT